MREVLIVLPVILMMTSMMVEADDLCSPDLFFYGQRFKRKPPEDITSKFETGLLYSIDLWNWTKNSTNSQGALHNLHSMHRQLGMDHTVWSIPYGIRPRIPAQFLRKTGRKSRNVYSPCLHAGVILYFKLMYYEM